MKGVKHFVSIFNYFYLSCIIIYAGSATVFARSLGDITTIGNAFALLITLLLVILNKIHFSSSYWKTIGIFSAFAICTFISNGRVSPMWYSQWIIWLTIAYCICQSFGKSLLPAYEKLMVYLCLISIPLWLSYVFFPSQVTSILETIQFSKPYAEDGNVAANILVFTVSPLDFRDNEFILIRRNAGFAWEPGAFASFICLALFCNIVRTKFRLVRNNNFWILVATLMTTQSTTGFMIFFFTLILWLVLNKKFWPFFVVIPIIIILFRLPFIQEKLLEEFEGLHNVNVAQLVEGKDGKALGRMMSLMVDFQDFLEHPIFGLGGYSDGAILQQYGLENVASISGIGKLLSRFGAIMTVVFLVLLTLSSYAFSKIFHNNNGYLLIVIIIGISFAYNLWMQPLLISFWMFYVFAKSKSKIGISHRSVGTSAVNIHKQK